LKFGFLIFAYSNSALLHRFNKITATNTNLLQTSYNQHCIFAHCN